MLAFFFGKWWYRCPPFHLSAGWQCATLSYGLFLAIGVLTFGLGSLVPYLSNQPMVPILCAVAVTWAYANGGVWQDELSHARAHVPFRLSSCTEQELRAHCASAGMSARDTENAVVAFCRGLSNKDLADMWGIERQSAKNKRQKLRRMITDPPR